jgi:hypothetical protein
MSLLPPGAGAPPPFDVLLVDEAAQALEPATLIPWQLLKPGEGRVAYTRLHTVGSQVLMFPP